MRPRSSTPATASRGSRRPRDGDPRTEPGRAGARGDAQAHRRGRISTRHRRGHRRHRTALRRQRHAGARGVRPPRRRRAAALRRQHRLQRARIAGGQGLRRLGGRARRRRVERPALHHGSARHALARRRRSHQRAHPHDHLRHRPRRHPAVLRAELALPRALDRAGAQSAARRRACAALRRAAVLADLPRPRHPQPGAGGEPSTPRCCASCVAATARRRRRRCPSTSSTASSATRGCRTYRFHSSVSCAATPRQRTAKHTPRRPR